MEMSGTIDKLAVALSKAQGEIEGAVKGKLNPHFKSKYAGLDSTWDACRKPLSKHGLSVVQMPFDTDGKIGVETMLLHESGEWIKGNISVRSEKDSNPQVAGSILTYLRRYSLQGAVGIAPEDDDGNAGAGKQPTPVDVPPVTIDDAVLKSLQEAKTTDEWKAAWNAIPVGNRHGYAAEREAARVRFGGGKAA